MVMTPEQKKATEAYKRKLQSDRQKEVKRIGADEVAKKIRRIRDPTSGSITEPIPGVFTVRDPRTGKLISTQDRSFAESIAGSGYDVALQLSKAEGGGRSGRSSTRLREELARRGETLAQARISTMSVAQMDIQRKIARDIARNKAQNEAANKELLRILNERNRLIRQGILERTTKSKNQQGDNLIVTQWRRKDGTRVERIENLTTGEVSYSLFAPNKKGGKVFMTGGIIYGGDLKGEKTAADIAKTYQIIPTKSGNYVFVRMPNGKHIRIGTKGRGIIGKKLAGHKLTFEDGVIIAVDGKSTGTREEFITPRGEVQYVPEKGSFWEGLQKTIVSKRFRSKKVAKEQEKKEEKWDNLMKKMKKGEKFNQTDISNYKEIAKFTPEDLVDKDVARFAQITGGVIGTVVAPIPGAIIWAMGDTMESVRTKTADGKKVSKQEFGKIVLDSATRGAILGFGMKMLGGVASLSSKRVLLTGALQRLENNAVRAAINHGGVLIKLVGRSGKNFITTYFLKDMAGNIFDVTADLKAGRLNNAIRKAIETGGSIGGYIGGSAVAKGLTKGALVVTGRLRPTIPEYAQKKIQLDVMAKQLLSEGKIVLTRRGVYETGKGLSPRKDAWLDSKIKNPTKSVFWRFDKTLSKKDQAISPLPLFTKSKTGYLKMFKSNWNKNKGLSLVKRYIKTTAETPLVEDVVIRRIIKLKDIKNLKLRKDVIRQYATTGKLNKATQAKLLKNPKFGISDKNREFGFHDENEYVTRTQFKFKGRKDISWTYDPTLQEYVPVVESLKTTSRIKNFLTILRKKKIITKTDAKFIADNYAIKTKFGAASILPNKHSYTHMKQVEGNILRLMNKYPQYNSYWKRQYGSVAKAREALKQAMWHDIGKGEAASKAFGTPHGKKVWNVWKAKLLPKGLKFKPKVAKAIKKHETLDPRKLWYKVQNKVKLITPEEKIVATADRLDLVRFGIKIDPKRLPLKDALIRLNIRQKDIKFPSSFDKIITKIKLDKGVTKADLKKIATFLKSKITKVVGKARITKYKNKKSIASYRSGFNAGKKAGLKAPKNYNMKHKGNKKAYIDGYKEGYSGRYLINYKTGKYKLSKRRVTLKRKRSIPKRRTIARGKRRPPKRPTKRPPRRPPKRPPKRPVKRPPKRPTRRPPKRPTKKPPITPRILPKKFKKRSISKAQPVYYIKVKKKGKLVNLIPRPLTLRDARDYLAYKLDSDLIRTGYFEPIGQSKNVVRLPKKLRGYFTRNKRKLRPYKIRVGKKKLLRNGYIEKKKFIGDTKTELRQLSKSRKKKRVVKRKIIKRKIKRNTVKRKPIKRRKTRTKKKK